MNFCPNKSHPDWKYIVEQSDESTAYKLFIINGFDIPNKEYVDKYLTSVSYNLKGVDIIISNLPKIKSWETNKSIDKNTLWSKIQQLGISKQQIDLLKESEGNTVEEKLSSFVANYSYTVEINTAKENAKTFNKIQGYDAENVDINSLRIEESDWGGSYIIVDKNGKHLTPLEYTKEEAEEIIAGIGNVNTQLSKSICII